MATLTDLLPADKAGRKTVRWTPADGDVLLDGLPLAGTLAVEGKRKGDEAEYLVTEFPTTWGRGFQLQKVSGGTDAEAEGYSVLCSKDGPQADSCECRGSLRHGHCKHVAAVRTLIANGWL